MKPVTSLDTKWTRLQTTQGPKHQHAKLWDLDVYQQDQLIPKHILAAQDSMIFPYKFGDLKDL
jgi:hypothetical protein